MPYGTGRWGQRDSTRKRDIPPHANIDYRRKLPELLDAHLGLENANQVLTGLLAVTRRRSPKVHDSRLLGLTALGGSLPKVDNRCLDLPRGRLPRR